MDSLLFLISLIIILVLLNINKISKLKLIRYIYLKYILPKLRADAFKVTLNPDILKLLEKGIKKDLYLKTKSNCFIDYTSITFFYKDRIIKNIEYDTVWNKIIIYTVDNYNYSLYIDHYSNKYLSHLVEYCNLLKLRKNYARKTYG